MANRFTGKNLSCIRGGRMVFKDLSFRLEEGDALVLRGPNGSGKSSLMRLMARLGEPATGDIAWNDEPIAADREAHAERLHYVGHKNGFKAALTVRENLQFWADLRDGPSTVDDALAAFGLDRLAPLPARFLSSGESRRLALARLTASKASLWLLDEPTVGIDQASLEALTDQIRQHRNVGGMVVVSIHGPFPLENSRTLDLGTRS